MTLQDRITFNRAMRELFPSYSYCTRCEISWAVTEDMHTTYYCVHGTDEYCRGVFPLCETCWSECSIEERLQFYETWMSKLDRESFGQERMDVILEAVRLGK